MQELSTSYSESCVTLQTVYCEKILLILLTMNAESMGNL